MTGDPRFFGISTNEIIPQPNFSATGNDEGKVTATQDFKCKRDFFESYIGQQKFREGVTATSLDPSLSTFWSFLRLAFTSSRHEDGGWLVITANYVGFWSATFDNDVNGTRPATYSLNGTLEEVSVMEHPTVLALAALERAWLSALLDGTYVWDVANSELCRVDDDGEWVALATQGITTTDGIAFADLIAKGQQTYKRPSYTWTKSEVSDERVAAADLNNLGKVDTPDGSPPKADDTRDWMLVSVDSTQEGTENPIYNNTLTWLLSERGGWDTDLYNY